LKKKNLRIPEYKTIILPVISYGFETWYLMLGAQHSLRVLRTIFGHEKQEITHPDRAWIPPSLLYDGCWLSFSEVKRPGHDIDHPPPYSTKDKGRIELSCISVWSFTACYRVNFTFILFRRRK
jgi:hypothetical protein